MERIMYDLRRKVDKTHLLLEDILKILELQYNNIINFGTSKSDCKMEYILASIHFGCQ